MRCQVLTYTEMKDATNNRGIQSPELLWEQFLKGDMLAFRTIYIAHYEALFFYGAKYLSNNEVEDSIQSLFLYILQHKKYLSKVSNVKAYLFKSLRNQITKLAKAKQLLYKHLDKEVAIEEENDSIEPLLTELMKILKKLSPREFEIIHMKYYQEYSNFEIADSLGLKNQTVRNTLRNALRKMRKYPYLSFE